MFGTLKVGKDVVKILPRLGRLGEEYILKKKKKKLAILTNRIRLFNTG